MVEIGKQLAKLVSIGVPVAKQGERKEIAQKERDAHRTQTVDGVEQDHRAHDEGAAGQQRPGVGQLVAVDKDEKACKQCIAQGKPFEADGPALG